MAALKRGHFNFGLTGVFRLVDFLGFLDIIDSSHKPGWRNGRRAWLRTM